MSNRQRSTTAVLVALLAMPATPGFAGRQQAPRQPQPGPAPQQPRSPGAPAAPGQGAFDFNRALEADLAPKVDAITGDRDSDGRLLDPNGTPVDDMTLRGAVMTRDLYAAQSEQFGNALGDLQAKPRDEKLEDLEEFREQAREVDDAYQNMLGQERALADLKIRNPRYDPQTVYEQLMTDAQNWESKGYKAYADELRQKGADTPWAEYLKRRQKFYETLDKYPELGVRDGQYFFEALRHDLPTTASDNEWLSLYDRFLRRGREHAFSEAKRAQGAKTVEDYWEYLSPKYGRQHRSAQAVGQLYGSPFPGQLVEAATAVRSGSDRTAGVDSGWTDFWLNVAAGGSLLIPGVGPFISAGIAGYMVAKDGTDLVITLLDEEAARAAGGTVGHVYTITEEDRGAAAAGKFVVSVAGLAGEMAGLSGVRIVKRTRSGSEVLAETGEAAAKSQNAASAPAAPAPGTATPAPAPDPVAPPPPPNSAAAPRTGSTPPPPATGAASPDGTPTVRDKPPVTGGDVPNDDPTVQLPPPNQQQLDPTVRTGPETGQGGAPPASGTGSPDGTPTVRDKPPVTGGDAPNDDITVRTGPQTGQRASPPPSGGFGGSPQPSGAPVPGPLKPGDPGFRDAPTMRTQTGDAPDVDAAPLPEHTGMVPLTPEEQAMLQKYEFDEMAEDFADQRRRAEEVLGKEKVDEILDGAEAGDGAAELRLLEERLKAEGYDVLPAPPPKSRAMDEINRLRTLMVRHLRGTLTEADLQWLREKLKENPNYLDEMNRKRYVYSENGEPLDDPIREIFPPGEFDGLRDRVARPETPRNASGAGAAPEAPPPPDPLPPNPAGIASAGQGARERTGDDRNPDSVAPSSPGPAAAGGAGGGGGAGSSAGGTAIMAGGGLTPVTGVPPISVTLVPGDDQAPEEDTFVGTTGDPFEGCAYPGCEPDPGCGSNYDCQDMTQCTGATCDDLAPDDADARDPLVQLMLVEIVVTVQRASAEPPHGPRALWGALRGGLESLKPFRRPALASSALAQDVRLAMAPLAAPSVMIHPYGGAQRGGSPVQMVLTSLGGSTGEALQIQVLNPLGLPIKLGGNGLVVEPMKRAAQQQVQRAVSQLASKNPVAAKVNGYCLEFLRQPPSAGTMFRIASPELQQRFAPMRRILQAAQRMEKMGLFKPDSDPTEYYHSIKQWALWAKSEKFDVKGFGDAFVEHAKKNLKAAGRQWTSQIETVIRGAVPHRWEQITQVLAMADAR
jgi:hypothetical protein